MEDTPPCRQRRASIYLSGKYTWDDIDRHVDVLGGDRSTYINGLVEKDLSEQPRRFDVRVVDAAILFFLLVLFMMLLLVIWTGGLL